MKRFKKNYEEEEKPTNQNEPIAKDHNKHIIY